jgi:DNA-binding CsgD family transcriptional regulator/PAS domain-containing protein
VLFVKQPSDTRPPHRFIAGRSSELAIQRAERFIAATAACESTLRDVSAGFATPADGCGEPALGHFAAAVDGRPVIAWLIFRSEGETPFALSERALLERLVPHLDRAFEMTQTFLNVTRERLVLAEVMDRLPAGILLLDTSGRVVFSNHSADRILARGDGLGLVRDMLRAEDADADAALQRCIAEVLAAPPGSKAGGMAIVPRSTAAVPYPISVTQLLPGEPIRFAVAAAIVNDPESSSEPAAELIRSLHGLTPAEAELVGILARGHSLEAAAERRGVSIHTVRSQLKQVFQKTGTSRQGELLQLVLRCFVPMLDES